MRKRTRFLLCWKLLFSITVSLIAQVDPHPLLLADTNPTENGWYYPAGIRTTTYYDLGCKHQGWAGYFAPQRWYKTADFGDGGVDVTEAPNARVAEGVTSARLDIQTGSSANYTWRITVPADGYLYFRLEKVGSFLSPRLNSTDTSLQILHNQESFTLEPTNDGSYFSPHLKAGDTFGVRFTSSKSSFSWNDLTFYSNSVGVRVTPANRTDLSFYNSSIGSLVTPATDNSPWVADKVKPVARASVDQIIFPSELPESWPLIDQDGNLETIDDQVSLAEMKDSDSPLIVSINDSPQLQQGQYWMQREFLVEEPCSNNILKIKRWWHPLPLVSPATEENPQ